MTDITAELSAQARLLPPEQRARLAQDLLASLDPGDADVDAAWAEEVRRRIEEVEAGKVRLVPAQQAFDLVRDSIAR